MLTTWLTENFDLSVPVVSAPMAGSANGTAAGAVCAAGALGTIGTSAGWSLDEFRREVSRAAAPGRAFGVGFLVWAWKDGSDAYLDAALEGGARLISLSYGDYARFIDRVHVAGALVATQVGTVAQALEAVDAGVDVVVARGREGGGHGQGVMSTLPLLQAVLDAVDVPVLAAGGIATARGVAAVLAAGAAGAWVGTAFLACAEFDITDRYREALVAAGEGSTVHTTAFDIGRGVPWPSEFGGRAIRNDFADRWTGREDELRQSGQQLEHAPYWAGEGVSMIGGVRTVAEVVAELSQAETLLRRFGGS